MPVHRTSIRPTCRSWRTSPSWPIRTSSGADQDAAETARCVCHSRSMNRSLVLKASALAKGTRRIPLFEEQHDEVIALDDAIDAEFVDVVEPVALAVAEPVAPAVRVTP